MYVYRWEESSQKYAVGYIVPAGAEAGKFRVESRKPTAQQARRRVNYLNGGSVPTNLGLSD